jgi:DNA-binding CsgD family transcriptional regulator/tetratricopeptide (TPR) repeat protein
MGKTKGSEGGSSPRGGDPALGDPAETRLFERDSELQQIEVALGQLHLGVGGCILIRGAAGTGKSRLMELAVASARATDLPVWYGHGGPSWRGEPLLTLREALGGVEPPSSVPESRTELVDEIETAVARVPHLLVMEDLQTADLASLTTLGELAEHVEQFPLLMLLAYRPNMLPHLPSGFEHATNIDLGPLSDGAAAAYAQHLLGAPAGPALRGALAETGGTPMHIWLWLRDLQDREALVMQGDVLELADPEERPAPLADLALARRRQMIGADAFELLRFVAVIGRRFRLEDLAAMAGEPPERVAARLQPLLDVHGATREGHWWLISWSGMVDNLYIRLEPADRAQLHRTYARLLQERDGSPVVVAEHQLAAARPGDREAVAAARRGAEAVRARVPETAAHLLRRAAALLPPGDPDRNQTLVELIEAELSAGRVDEARRLAEDEVARVPPGPMHIRLQLTLLSVYEFSSESKLEDLAAAMLSGTALDADVRRNVLVRRALERVATGRLDDARTDAEAVLVDAPTPPDEVSSVAVTVLAWIATNRGDPEEALRLLRASATGPLTEGPSEGLSRLREAMALCALDRFDEALEVLHTSLRELDRVGALTRILPALLDGIAYAYYGQGAWDDALDEWEEVLSAQMHQVFPAASRARQMRALIAAHRGDYGPARELRERREARLDTLERSENLQPEVLLLAHEGDPAAANRVGLQAWAADDARGDYSELPFWLPWEIRFARDAELPDGELQRLVAPMADRLLPLARQWTTDSVVGAANLARGIRDQNAAALTQAAQRYRHSVRAPDRCIGLDVCGEELLRLGHHDLGVEALLGALDSYRALDAEPGAERVLRRLRELGVRRGLRRPRVRPGVGWDSLSQEELTIAALVSSGLSNPQIAEHMDLPRHRVANIIERVIAKLGVASRLELGLLVARRARDQELLQKRTPPDPAGTPE